jgi:uncharacterized membrane-anchored protein YjiN (DUF445 family)
MLRPDGWPHGIGPSPATDLAAARALARQKALATGLVVLCAMIFVGAKALEARHPAIAYVAAFAEAAIIGALADWYAVTALFRHPLGLKLPHTAIIAANQTRIAEAIGNFIAKHFLAGPRVGEKVLELDPAASAGRWLAAPGNRKAIAAQAARFVPDAIEAIDQEMLRGEIERSVLERLGALDMSEVIGTSLEVITRNRRHHAILDEVLGRIEARLAEPAALNAIRDRIRAELPTLFRFFLADAYLLQRLIGASHSLLTEVRRDPAHPLRAEFDRLIAEFVVKLRSSPEHREKVEALKHELLARAELREILAEGFDRLVASLRADIEREDGLIRPGFETFLSDFAEKLQHDRDLRTRLNRWLAKAAAAMTERYKHEVAAFVATQVKSWNTQHAVRTIELSLGKDLQYIRINGTLVGGLLGLVIFSATRLALP